ncbi:alternate-type signal peptide domain-containing protein [Naasia lichenicola]|uniref:Alternate-type signal peptide domain-containing protein n=1 Tax=Naasia lichenicola TaxID=2565933 RepID=A0A4V3WTG5_9MICO|nr:alternate-type signal peptide domain-containing protein [Naasia lichenicola]THG31867.1 alternate-type signal peptide domain-containing protein [Naasia lichenicola]
MNRIVKGSIAGVIGIALLTGGAGTFALWNSTASVSAGTITAGNLALVANTDGVWKDGSTTITPATYKIIPGKTLTYTQTLKVTAVGDGLSANLTVSSLTATGTNSLNTLITPSLAVTSASSNVTVSGSTITVTSSATDATVLATVTLTFPSTATAGQLGTINLSSLTFTLTQN